MFLLFMESVREAFNKVKEDIDFLKREISYLKSKSLETNERMIDIYKIIEKTNKKTNNNEFIKTKNTPTNKQQTPMLLRHSSTHNSSLEALKDQNLHISTGNEGVPTDKQTNRQTDKQPQIYNKNPEKSIEDALEIINSLDNIKKEIRLKFKRLTNQEFLVFSTLYQLDQEVGYSNYKIISQKLHLSESSIRDYIGRLIRKGIPIEKNKINNKNIQLLISKNLKKIATLQTILQLRGI